MYDTITHDNFGKLVFNKTFEGLTYSCLIYNIEWIQNIIKFAKTLCYML